MSSRPRRPVAYSLQLVALPKRYEKPGSGFARHFPGLAAMLDLRYVIDQLYLVIVTGELLSSVTYLPKTYVT